MISSSRYGRQVKYLLKKYWQQWKTWCFFENNRIVPSNEEVSNVNMELEELA